MLENNPTGWHRHLPKIGLHTHKYSRGHALVYGGSYMTGAARLSALACARAGAGATTLACSESVWPIYASSLLSIIVRSWRNIDEALALLQSSHGALLIGPGATDMPELMPLVTGLVSQHNKNYVVVLDADALTCYEYAPLILFKQILASSATVVLTPHEGEFARLFPDLGLKTSLLTKAQRALQAAQRSGAIIVLKGNDTIIAHPEGHIVKQSASTPFLATAGSGDVLSGLITGLCAQAMPPFAAACAAVWIHNQAALVFGPGLIAEDIISHIPVVWQRLLGS